MVRSRERLTVLKPRGWTSTPRVAMYFFSNSPVRWRLTKVVCNQTMLAWAELAQVGAHWRPRSRHNKVATASAGNGANCELTLPVPPSPTRTSLKVGIWGASAMLCGCVD
jgi:hypothetical protein